ncbi:hypothetical protein [Rhabdochlamydiaceae symbiont of Dictyostelium giganteum]|uniref:hypothetical protein n=1 Tax=Rhabdochlamydiaceae symbiont of Dictyostelium giganteum TaxID=3342349 RepID=UPI00384BE572
MVRMSKQSERRAKSPHRPRSKATKTGPKKDDLPQGFKFHATAIGDSSLSTKLFIPKKIG